MYLGSSVFLGGVDRGMPRPRDVFNYLLVPSFPGIVIGGIGGYLFGGLGIYIFVMGRYRCGSTCLSSPHSLPSFYGVIHLVEGI